MRNIDLHTHSVYSDGTYTPTELVSYAKKKGLSAISITDHDTIDGLDEARQQSDILGICFINGVEINSFCCINNNKINIHVLGYMFIPSEIKAYMTKLKTLRYEHNEAIINALRAIGIDIDYADMNIKGENNTITRLNFARTLVQKGYANTVKEALYKYLRKGGAAYVEYCNQPFSVVAQRIHDAGGIVSLAHPAQYGLNYFETESLVRSLANIGLDAIECIHPSQDISYSQKIMNLAKQNNLVITGGSDFHGKNDDGIDLGIGGDQMLIPESFLIGLRVT